jgi:enolase
LNFRLNNKISGKTDLSARLNAGWVIANHKLVSFHAAFISSLFSLTGDLHGKGKILKFVFASPETLVSAALTYTSWHTGIAIHEMGHYLKAAHLKALNKTSQDHAEQMMARSPLSKAFWYAKMFIQIPWGCFPGIKKEGGNFGPDAAYNLSVSAAGQRTSGKTAAVLLPLSVGLGAAGLLFGSDAFIYASRLFLGPGVVGYLDYLMADKGKLKEYSRQEKIAQKEKGQVAARATLTMDWLSQVDRIKRILQTERITKASFKGMSINVPWQFRNCAMGGRHTEKEHPESNISMQESMFIPLSPKTFEAAQEMTIKLQNRLKTIIENAPRARILGIGLEGGLAPYIEKDQDDKVPEQRLWRMMKDTILECGYIPGADVAIAFDPAASELENAYREETNNESSVGTYLFWRDKNKVVMTRDELLKLYIQVMRKDGIPIVSIEDGFGERDHIGWKDANKELGEKILLIGDDLVTTKDSTIEIASQEGLINTVLIKANQIGTLIETINAMLVSIAYGNELVISHRSKSPNDPFEADIAIALGALGGKWGGGANTERLQKYGRVIDILNQSKTEGKATDEKELDILHQVNEFLPISLITGTEEPTNAGIPSGAASIFLGSSGVIRFKGSTPLGTSAGEDEALHLVDSMIPVSKLTTSYPDLFQTPVRAKTAFKKNAKYEDIKAKGDQELSALWEKAQRYAGKGCSNAVDNIDHILGPAFVGKKIADFNGLVDIDRTLLGLELRHNISEGLITSGASRQDQINVMQRKSILGMNAILPMSFALARAYAFGQGKELWQVIREQAIDMMAKFIVLVDRGLSKDSLEDLQKKDIEDLKKKFYECAQTLIKDGVKITEKLYEVVPIYPAEEQVNT